MSFDIRALRQKEAEKYAQLKAQQEQEQQAAIAIEQQKLQTESDAKMVAELQEREELDDCLGQLENLLIQTQTAGNITEIDLAVLSFMTVLEGSHLIGNEEVRGKVIEMINSISNNENSKYDVTKRDDHGASRRIVDNVKVMMAMVGMEGEIDVEAMDTEGDAEMAKKIQDEDESSDEEPNKHVKIHDPIKHMLRQRNAIMGMRKPVRQASPPKTEFYAGFEPITDPEILQLLHYQDEFED